MEVNGVFEASARVEAILGWAADVAAPPGDFGAVLEIAESAPSAPLGLPVDPASGVATAAGWTGSWVSRLPAQGRRWAPAIEAAARRHGLDPVLLGALVWAESSFRPDAVSEAGAIGLTQLMPGTAAGLGVDPYDPLENLEGGARYLAAQIRRFGSVELGLAAYQAGPGAVAATGGIPSAGTRAYVERVLGYARILGLEPAVARAGAAPTVERSRIAPIPPGSNRVNPLVVQGTPTDRAPTGPQSVLGGPGVRAEGGADRIAGRPAPIAGDDGQPREVVARKGVRPVGVVHDPGAGAAGTHLAPDAPHPPVGSALPDPLTVDGQPVRDAAVRLVELVEGLRDAAPPRRLAVELPELGGLRLLVEVRGTTIHVQPLGGDLSWFDALVRDLGPSLAARGFDLAGRAGRDPRDTDEPAPSARGRPPRPRPSEGVRM